MIWKKILYGLAIILALIISISYAWMIPTPDFPVFYNTALIILDPDTANGLVYSTENINDALPESARGNCYVYSMAAAYILAPLGLVPYYVAKASLNFVNMVCYFTAVITVLRLGGATGRLFLYPLVLSFFWMPFYHNILFAQINGVLLLLVTLAVLAAIKKNPAMAGLLLGIAALFKLFPIAIAMVLGLKNWRILAACIVTVSVSLLLPDSGQWFAALHNVSPYGYSYIYRYIFNQFGQIWFWLYAGGLGCLTALITGRARSADYGLVASFAIPASLLAMPIVEYHHFTLLIFPILYLSTIGETNRSLLILLMIIFATICIPFVYGHILVTPIQFAGAFALWMAAATQLSGVGIRDIPRP